MTQLNLNITNLKARKPSKPLAAEILRPLNEADLALASTAGSGAELPQIKKLSDRHHSLARLIASGTKLSDCALITGYDPSRISILQASPAFQELVELYRSEVDRQFATNLSHMAGLSRDALLELRDRFEEDPDKFSNRELMSLVNDLTDRTAGYTEGANAPTRIELAAPVHDPEVLKAKFNAALTQAIDEADE